MANNRKAVYAGASNLTISLASGPLASDSTLLAGRQSTAVDNSSNLYVDYLLSGFISTGTTPTTGKTIEVWVVPELDDSSWPDAIGASDANVSFTSTDIKNLAGALWAVIPTDGTTARKYPLPKVSVASLFGGVCPRKFVVFVVHNTAVALNSTAGNHQITAEGYYENLNG